MDAMVTARMQATKKEAGNRVLASLGTNASAVINELYDYILSHKALPWGTEQALVSHVSPERLQEALAWVDGLQVSLSKEFADMSLKDARIHRLTKQSRGRS